MDPRHTNLSTPSIFWLSIDRVAFATSCSSILLSVLYTFVKPCCSSNLFVTTGIKSRPLENDIDDCDLSGKSPGNRLSRCLRLIAELKIVIKN
uniref:Uncharacterized protein n=1 Tax=Glossina palpalis gambiensis TaxID=67801 RepID=A0A1B0BGP5_9MUSC